MLLLILLKIKEIIENYKNNSNNIFFIFRQL